MLMIIIITHWTCLGVYKTYQVRRFIHQSIFGKTSTCCTYPGNTCRCLSLSHWFIDYLLLFPVHPTRSLSALDMSGLAQAAQFSLPVGFDREVDKAALCWGEEKLQGRWHSQGDEHLCGKIINNININMAKHTYDYLISSRQTTNTK